MMVTENKWNFQEIECQKGHLLKLIGVQQPVTPQSQAKGQTIEEQPIKELPFEKQPLEQLVEYLPLEQHVEEIPIEAQVQMNSVTPQTVQ